MYTVILLDTDGYHTAERPAGNLKEAKQIAAYFLSPEFARSSESTHEAMRSHKAEVRNSMDECIYDRFLN